jgi:flagellar protein FliO/FliZ
MDSSILPSFFKMLFALAIVLGLMVGAAYFFKRIFPGNGGCSNDHSLINVVASRYLGPRSSIMLVEVLGKIIVVGVSPNQISPLATITETEALERLKHASPQAKRPPSLIDFIKQNKVLNSSIRRLGRNGRGK